ncbi:ABC transporter permease [bacterium]|nr:ABC transporter permease [bacterium]
MALYFLSEKVHSSKNETGFFTVGIVRLSSIQGFADDDVVDKAHLKEFSRLDEGLGETIIGFAGECLAGGMVVSDDKSVCAVSDDGLKNVAGWARSSDIILPAITLCFGVAAYLARLTRGGMLDVLSQDYIRSARAKGVGPLQVITTHALRPALMPAVTFLGPAFAAIITGSFVVENIFLVPGMGQFFVLGVTTKDYNLVLGLVLFYGILMGIANLLSDLALIFMDPKLRKA